MTYERMIELKGYTDIQKWPNWENVMYHCGVTREETLEFLKMLINDPWVYSHVLTGLENYIGYSLRTIVEYDPENGEYLPDGKLDAWFDEHKAKGTFDLSGETLVIGNFMMLEKIRHRAHRGDFMGYNVRVVAENYIGVSECMQMNHKGRLDRWPASLGWYDKMLSEMVGWI